jgi:predicted TIM-barrel fold metal-dependent hydrolase
MRAVDTHAHVFSQQCRIVPDARYRPAYFALAQDWISLWPGAQVSHGVLVQPSFLGTDNRYLLEQLDLYGDRMRGVAVVAPGTSRSDLAAWNEIGVRGIRLNLIGVEGLDAYAGPEWQTLFAMLADLGWHVEIQCEGERLPRLFACLGAAPPALVFDHFGLPDPQAGGNCAGVTAILREAAKRRLYVKLSAPYRLRGADAHYYARRYAAELGAERLLWGSDWPWTNHEAGRRYMACRELLDAWISSASDRQAILWDAPGALYGFGA